MAPLPLVYVHGAARSRPRPSSSARRPARFGEDMPSSRVAHYASVRWSPPTSGGAAPRRPTARTGPAARKRSARRWRQRSRRTWPPRRSSRPRSPRPDRRAGEPRPARPAVGEGRGRGQRLVEELYREADRVARRSPIEPRGAALRITLPGPDLPLHRRQVRQRRRRLPVRAVHGGDARAGAPGAPGQPVAEGDRRPQPRHHHHLRRPVGGRAGGAQGRPAGHRRLPARDRQRPGPVAGPSRKPTRSRSG